MSTSNHSTSPRHGDQTEEGAYAESSGIIAAQSGANWEMLEAILQGNPVATFVIDDEHRVTHWNRACELITGIPAADIIGTRDQWRGFYPEARPILADLVADGELAQAEQKYEGGNFQPSTIVEGAYVAEAYFPRAGGTGRWLYFTAAPVCDAQGKIVGAIETLQDITERKNAEHALQEQNDNLERMVALRTAQLEDAKAALEADVRRRQQVEEALLERNAELIELTEQRSQLEERVNDASSTAMTAMSSMGEMGVLLQALQHYNGCRNFQEIGAAMIASLGNYELTGVVQVRIPEGNIEIASNGNVSSHDTAVIGGLRDMGRIVHFHSRMIINYDRISLLIHNVPKEDTEKTGRIRDNLAMLVEAADVRISALLAEGGSVSRQDAILKSMTKIGSVLSNMERKQHESLSASSVAIHDMSSQLEKLFVHLGLSSRQEEMLLELVNASIDQISVAQAGQLNFQQELAEIIRELGAFSS